MQTLDKLSIKRLLEARFENDDIQSLSNLPSPFDFKDMSKAVDRIIKAIENKENIVLVSDYDVDGVTSRVMIEVFFEYIGAKIISITPNRFKDGYGLSTNLIKDIKADVVITVDNGITSYDAGNYCFENNIDLIITDHHIASKLPKAYAIVNPKQQDCSFPFEHICGAQIAWYLIAGIKSKLDIDFNMKSILDILVLAIVADVMPLISINRVLVKKALKIFASSNRPFTLAIKDILQKNIITSSDIAFNIAPKINAAGRLEDASIAVEFLKSKNIQDAKLTFEYLIELNKSRKEIQEDMFIKSCKMHKSFINDNVIVAIDESFHMGVIGIVASKLAQKFKKIALVGTLDKDSNIIKISGRSWGGVDLYELLNMCSDNIDSFGGHKEAAGLNLHLSKLDIFKDQINKAFNNHFSFKDINNIFGILKLQDVDKELADILDNFEPFGHQNERPIFLIQDIEILKSELIGKDKKTLRLTVDTPQGIIFGIKFDYDGDINTFSQSKNIDITATINKNIYNSNEYIQLLINEVLIR